ncbi:Uroporphyrinogen decarboxylase [Chytriomyces sp. MP71]|nr:Uroporphyrinogen decarboxylase [Chytriomyces sp. MP71]
MSPADKVLRNVDFPVLKNDLILRAARGEKIERTPVWIMRQAGRYLPEFRAARLKNDFFTVCRTPELACEVTLQPIDRFDGLLDASIIFSDIMVVPQAMGLTVEMLDKVGPSFPNPLRKPEDMERLSATVDVHETLQYVFDAITLTRTKLEGRVPLIGFTGAPWTLMAYMVEGSGSKAYSKAKAFLYQWPEASHVLLKRITAVCVDYLVGQVKAGAQMLQVFDSNAGELTPTDFEEFALPYLLDIATRVKKQLKEMDLDAPMIVFARNAHCGLEALSKSEYDVIQVDYGVSPAFVHKYVHKRKVLQGNADPALLYAPVEKIREVVEKMLDGFGTEKGYIANLGHGMNPDHDPEHLRAYLLAINEYSTQKNSSKKRKASSKKDEGPSPKR